MAVSRFLMTSGPTKFNKYGLCQEKCLTEGWYLCCNASVWEIPRFNTDDAC